MSFRFWRRVKLFPGVTLNFSKSNVSLSVGPPGAKYTFSPLGNRATVGIPGSGLYYTVKDPGRGAARSRGGSAGRAKPSVESRLELGFLQRLLASADEKAFVDGLLALHRGDEQGALARLEEAPDDPDASWLAGFLRGLGIRPVRGSRHRRGAEALRELIAAQRDGFDVAITPDGSRGPLYEMKPGALGLALKTGAPLVLLSFNFDRAWRLKTWDGFYLPLPFTGIEVRMEQIPPEAARGGGDSPEALTARLKARLDAMTVDAA
mgnify:CR=1 FL=1